MNTVSPSKKRYCCHLPPHLAVRFDKLYQAHPELSHEKLMCNLLGLALYRMDKAPEEHNPQWMTRCANMQRKVYLLFGPFSEFHGLFFKHHSALDKDYIKNEIDIEALIDEYMPED